MAIGHAIPSFETVESLHLRCILQRESSVNDSFQLPFRQKPGHLLHLAPIWLHKAQVVFGSQTYCSKRQPTNVLKLELTDAILC